MTNMLPNDDRCRPSTASAMTKPSATTTLITPITLTRCLVSLDRNSSTSSTSNAPVSTASSGASANRSTVVTSGMSATAPLLRPAAAPRLHRPWTWLQLRYVTQPNTCMMRMTSVSVMPVTSTGNTPNAAVITSRGSHVPSLSVETSCSDACLQRSG